MHLDCLPCWISDAWLLTGGCNNHFIKFSVTSLYSQTFFKLILWCPLVSFAHFSYVYHKHALQEGNLNTKGTYHYQAHQVMQCIVDQEYHILYKAKVSDSAGFCFLENWPIWLSGFLLATSDMKCCSIRWFNKLKKFHTEHWEDYSTNYISFSHISPSLFTSCFINKNGEFHSVAQ